MSFDLSDFPDRRQNMDVGGRPTVSAAVQLTSLALPKPSKGQRAAPSFLRTAKPSTAQALTREERNLANTDITTYRTNAGTPATIRSFVKSSPDLSAAVTSYTRTGITNTYTAVAKNPDGSFNRDATLALQQVIVRMNILSDPKLGFDDAPSIRSLCESWVKDLMTYGGMACELVLDSARMPDKIQPISASQIKMYPTADGKRLTPKQLVGGEEIDLNFPTFFMLTLDQDLLSPYCESPLESALQPVLFSAQFMNDIRRVVQRAIHPRLTVTIDEDKIRKNLPQDVAVDPDKLAEYLQELIGGLQSQIDSLQPHEALVVWDCITIEMKDHGNTNLSNEYTALDGMANAKLATGAKVFPTVLGHSSGTSNVASAEVLLYMKNVEGGPWAKINEMMSKVLTMGMRLLGQDVYVEFTQKAIELRPESELEAFKAMEQSRILDQLSLGLITDEEACVRLTGSLPPAGYVNKSGTMFRSMGSGTTPAGDGYNGASNNGSTMNQNLKSDAPTGIKGPQKKADVIHMPMSN